MTTVSLGISACLAGEPVRHDGGHRRDRFCTEELSRFFSLVPLCPEAGAGLGVPRPVLQLREQCGTVRLVSRREGEDHTAALENWSARQPALETISGFVLMGKSPSCGMARVRCYDAQGSLLHAQGEGVFARFLREQHPFLPVEEAGRLNDPVLRENFIARVYVYQDWQASQPFSAASLIAFHTRHKLQLLAHDQTIYRQLGRLLASMQSQPVEQVATRYWQQLMPALARPAKRGAHVNVLQHIAGYFRRVMDNDERQAMQEQIAAYWRGEVPLVVPVTLLRHWLRRAPNAYLAGQVYLQPYPDALGLRNGV